LRDNNANPIIGSIGWYPAYYGGLFRGSNNRDERCCRNVAFVQNEEIFDMHETLSFETNYMRSAIIDKIC